MSIQAVGGGSAAQQLQHVQAASLAESGEIPGKPDHDGDADDTTSVAATNASAKTAPGNFSVDV